MKNSVLLLLCLMVTLTACDNANNLNSKTTTASINNNAKAKQGLWVNQTTHTDKGIVYTATLEATAGQTSFDTPIKLIIRCNNGQSELAINWGNHAPRGTKIPTDLRIGNEQVISNDWRVIRETTLAYQYQPEKTLAQLVNNKELLARTIYFKGGIATAYFKLEGMDQAVKDIRKTCHW